MRVRFVEVASLSTKAKPTDCDNKKAVKDNTLQSLQEAFPDRTLFVWDHDCWNEVDNTTRKLVVEGARLKLVVPDQRASPSTPATLHLPAEFWSIVAKKKGRGELFDDQLTIGGSSADLRDVDEALVRHHLGRRVRQLVKNDGQLEKSFNWNAAAREDDSSNMEGAVAFVQSAMADCCSVPVEVLGVESLQVFAKSEATPQKRTAVKATKTDIIIVPPEWKAAAKEKPESVLDEIYTMVDLKKPETWFPNLKKNRGQVLSQYTIGTYRTGRDLPAMMTDLNGNSHIFHQETSGGELLTKEVVFQNQAQAFKYLGRLIEEASKALAQPIDFDDALKSLTLAGPTFSPGALKIWHHTDAQSDLDAAVREDIDECCYNEMARNSGQALPSYRSAQAHASSLREGMLAELDPNRLSYIA
ncbi:hypothetical protein KFL_003120120 [Klebsormidium nitens]|uniref:Uncharacterized protein n=1 Tax=Klebsormidium nitens TaxID=105231 RepID=A0A1Y1I772_KLENI|nr:hypothetical protein KFL_003120120 [Klebsormidium nitens]|eukprot:GAQ86805.1 hypothetical protein KFL_003120120 [Klebsormidium nitens]